MFITLAENNGTLVDVTRYTKKLGQDSIDITFASGDAVYVGSKLKFNHAYISSTIKPLATVGLNVKLWDGSEFAPVARVIDETDGLSSDGIVEFSPSAKRSWSSADTEQIPELSTMTYYGMYWIKLELNSSDAITLDYVGHKFSNDFDLFSEHPELKNPSFAAYFNQDNFDKQAILAAELIEKRLIKLGYAEGSEQVLQWEDLTLASVSKTAQLIYTSFGNAYADNVKTLSNEFAARVDTSFPIIDVKNTGIKDTAQKITGGLLYR